MKRFLIDSLADVASAMYENIVSIGHHDVMFVGKYEDAIVVIKELLMYDEVLPHHIKITPEFWDGYDKEYYVTLDEDMDIWCEKAYDYENARYVYDETECLFIADDCNSAILSKVFCPENTTYEVSYILDEEEIECDCNCECCQCMNDELSFESNGKYHNISKTKDGKVAGFSTTWTNEKDGETSCSSFSYYGDNEETVKRLAKEFGIEI